MQNPNHTYTVSAGTTIRRVDGTRTFKIEAMRARIQYVGTQYQQLEVEVDMRNVDTGELHEYLTVNESFFARYEFVSGPDA